MLVATTSVSTIDECAWALEEAGMLGVGVDSPAAAAVIAQSLAIEAVLLDGELHRAARAVRASVLPHAPAARFVLVGRGVEVAAGYVIVARPHLDPDSIRVVLRDVLGIEAPRGFPKPLARAQDPLPRGRRARA